MDHFRGALNTVLTVFLAGGISVASAGVITQQNYGDATVTEYSDQASLSAALALQPTLSVNFTGIAAANGFVFEGSSFNRGPLAIDDNGGAELFVFDNGYSGGLDAIGTGEAVLQDNSSGNGINITFPFATGAVGLVLGDPFANGGLALFNLNFKNGSSDFNNIGTAGELALTGGATPNYYEIQANGSPITEINFNDNAGFPTIDTVAFATPEPAPFWLMGLTLASFLGVRLVRKHRPSHALRALRATPVAIIVAGVAMFVAPVHSFAQPVNCNLAVPNNPLTAAGLATPYLLSPGDAGCSQSTNMAFVQAAIYDPGAHTISVYTPLIADAPTNTPGMPRTPRYAISPVVPHLPANAVVALWFGYNTNNLTLTGTAVTNGTCFTGFGQYASCNTTAFWAAVNADTTLQLNTWNPFKGQLGSDGQACPTARSFSIVDQDPTDNLPVSFLLTNETPSRTAQDTIANRATLTGKSITFTTQINPSDEVVVDRFIDGALGCNPPLVADLTDPGQMRASLAVNELFAGLQSGQFPAINPTSIYGTGSTQLRGPALVAIGDTFNLVPTFQQPTTPSAGYPYTGGEITAFDNYVAAMGYNMQSNPQTISGTLQTGAGTAFARTNQYRASTNQPLAVAASTATPDGSLGDASVQTYCTKLYTRTAVGDNSPADLLFNKDLTAFNQAGNGPGGSDLFIFLGDRFAASYDLLGCAAVFGKGNPVNVANVNATTPGAPVLPYYPVVFP
jgi:hypothetical protein